MGVALLGLGLALVLWAGAAWLWGDPFTALYTKLRQQALEREYERVATSRRGELSDYPPAEAARRYRASLAPGDPVGRLGIPALGLDVIVVEGTEPSELRSGPGHHRGSALPGEGELVYLAGHRTTFGAPFARIDWLAAGDRLTFELPYGVVSYVVTGSRIVDADDLSVLRSRGRDELVLQACHPRFLARQRLLVYARHGSIRPTPP